MCVGWGDTGKETSKEMHINLDDKAAEQRKGSDRNWTVMLSVEYFKVVKTSVKNALYINGGHCEALNSTHGGLET